VYTRDVPRHRNGPQQPEVSGFSAGRVPSEPGETKSGLVELTTHLGIWIVDRIVVGAYFIRGFGAEVEIIH